MSTHLIAVVIEPLIVCSSVLCQVSIHLMKTSSDAGALLREIVFSKLGTTARKNVSWEN